MPSPPRTARRELTLFEKTVILAQYPALKSMQKCADKIGRPYSTVRDFLHCVKARHSIDNKPRAGRPPALNRTTKRRLVREARANRKQTLRQLRNLVAPNVSIDTVQRALREEDIMKHRGVKRPKLKQRHADCRKAFAAEHLQKTIEFWKRIIWSDECYIERSRDPRCPWFFRRPGEKYHPDCVNLGTKGPDIKVMIWACFYYDTLGPMVPFVVKSMNNELYIKMLDSLLLPVIEKMRRDRIEPIFMQDNASVHTARIVKEWMREKGVEVLEWPALSPDLNPIEHLWVRLKSDLQDKHPELADLGGGADAVKERLREVLPDIWWGLDRELLKKLVESLPRRVQSLYDAKGWFTKY